MSDPLHGGIVAANPELAAVTSAAGELLSWTGKAASKFKTKFLDPFPMISSNQFLILVTMKGALEAHRTACEKAREDILRIAQAAVDQIDNARECNASDWQEFLQVAAAVATVGGAVVATGPGATFAMVGAVTAAGGLVADAKPGAKGAVGITGDEIDDIIESMRNSVDILTTEIRETQKRIVDAVMKSASLVYEMEDKFVSARPALAGMSGERITTDDGLGTAT